MEERVAGMRTTGRRVSGPAADLVEVVSEEGVVHTALVFHERFRDHPALRDELEPLLPFLRDPGVSGLLPLVAHDPAEGAFVYATGTAWSVAELVRVFADNGDAAGVRAGLELCYLAAEILVDAVEASYEHDLLSHRSLDPRRVLVRADGQVLIMGYGLPPLDLLEHLETGRRPRDEDTVRYAPPERFEELEEDIASDLYCLALVGLELTMGRPVYDGLADDIRQQASRGDAVRRLYQWRERLPDTVREVYSAALKPDPDARYRDGVDFVYAFHDLLGSLDADGPGLVEVMATFRASVARGRAPEGVATGSLSRQELAELAADLGELEQRPLPPPRKPRPSEEEEPDEDDDPGEQRWSRVRRARGEERQAADGSRDEGASGEGGARDRLRERLRERGGRSTSGSARDRLKARLRSRSSGSGAEPRPRRLARDRDEDPGPARPVRRGGDPSGEPVTADYVAPAEPEPAPSPVPSPAPSPVPSPTPEPAPSAVTSGSAAAALLERLRGGARADATPASTTPASPAAPSQAAPSAPVSPSHEVPSAPAPSQPAPSSAPAAAPAPAPKAAASRPPKSPAPSAPTPPVPPASPKRASSPAKPLPEADTLPRASLRTVEPDSEPLSVPLGETGTISFQFAVGGRAPRPVEVEAGITVAQGVSQAVDTLDAAATDLLGNLAGWWRAAQLGQIVPGHLPIEELDPRDVIELVPVPNRIRTLQLEVVAPSGLVRFRAPIGTGVPTRFLLAHLVGWLGLPEGDWRVRIGDRTVGPHQVLAELDPDDDTILVVAS